MRDFSPRPRPAKAPPQAIRVLANNPQTLLRNHQLSPLPPCNLFHFRRKKQNKTSPARPTLNPNRPSMPIHNLRHKRKPQPDPSFLRRHKRIKNLLPQPRRNSRPSVFNSHFDPIAPARLRLLHPHPQRHYRFVPCSQNAAPPNSHREAIPEDSLHTRAPRVPPRPSTKSPRHSA